MSNDLRDGFGIDHAHHESGHHPSASGDKKALVGHDVPKSSDPPKSGGGYSSGEPGVVGHVTGSDII
jgi:hypothetical protein